MCWDDRCRTADAIRGNHVTILSQIAIEAYRANRTYLTRSRYALESLKKFFRSARNGEAIIMARPLEDPYHADNFSDAALFYEIHCRLMKDNPYPHQPVDTTSLLRELEAAVDSLLATQLVNDDHLKNLEHFLGNLQGHYQAHIIFIGCY